MQGIYALLIMAVIMVVAAVFIYSRSENTSFDKLVDQMQETKGNAKRAINECSDIRTSMLDTQAQLKTTNDLLVQAIEGLSKLQTEIGILQTRQHGLDKKLLAKDRTVNLNLNPNNKPVEVEIIQRDPKKESLIKKAGIK